MEHKVPWKVAVLATISEGVLSMHVKRRNDGTEDIVTGILRCIRYTTLNKARIYIKNSTNVHTTR
jgi:hypothetical protein